MRLSISKEGIALTCCVCSLETKGGYVCDCAALLDINSPDDGNGTRVSGVSVGVSTRIPRTGRNMAGRVMSVKKLCSVSCIRLHAVRNHGVPKQLCIILQVELVKALNE